MKICQKPETLKNRKLVFFFDEAHMLFNDAPQVLIDKVEQVVRLIRSKGVGVFFVTQSPADIPGKSFKSIGQPSSARLESVYASRSKGCPYGR